MLSRKELQARARIWVNARFSACSVSKVTSAVEMFVEKSITSQRCAWVSAFLICLWKAETANILARITNHIPEIQGAEPALDVLLFPSPTTNQNEGEV